MAKVQRAMHCKRAILNPAGGTLQDLLKVALQKCSTVRQRSQNIGVDIPAVRYRLIGQHYTFKTALAGILVSYEPGAKASSLIKDEDADQLPLDSYSAPPAPGGKTREWVEGLLYFLVRENHLVFIQAMSVRHQQLEEYLTWFLSPPDSALTVTLVDQPPKGIAKQIRDHHVKKILIGGSLLEVAPTETVEKEGFKIEGALFEAVKAAIGTDNQSFKWNEGLDGNLEARIELTYRRATTESAQHLLDQLALAFRKTEGVETWLTLGNGNTLSASTLHQSTKRSIEAKDGQLNTMEAFNEMYNWLEQLAQTDQL